MQSENRIAAVSKKALWIGRIISALPILFLLMDSIMKLAKLPIVVETTVKIGYAENTIVPLGIVLLVSTLLYAIPRTSAFGAILLTAYLGGAVATHVRLGEGLFPVSFPIILGVLIWGGLWLRDTRLRQLTPLRKGEAT